MHHLQSKNRLYHTLVLKNIEIEFEKFIANEKSLNFCSWEIFD